MKIRLTLGENSMGDFNSHSDNCAYVQAVQNAIEKEYPNADVSVDMVENGSNSTVTIFADEIDRLQEEDEHEFCFRIEERKSKIENDCDLIAKKIWDSSEYKYDGHD